MVDTLKDIDIIAKNDNQRNKLSKGIVQAGYKQTDTQSMFKEILGKPMIFKHTKHYSIDIFSHYLCKLFITSAMWKRSVPIKTNTKHLKLHIAHTTDIALIKIMAPLKYRHDIVMMHSQKLINRQFLLLEWIRQIGLSIIHLFKYQSINHSKLAVKRIISHIQVAPRILTMTVLNKVPKNETTIQKRY